LLKSHCGTRDSDVCLEKRAVSFTVQRHRGLREDKTARGFGPKVGGGAVPLEFDFTDKGKSAGVSRPILAGSLKEVTTWAQTITEHDLLHHLREAFSAAEATAITAKIQIRNFEEIS
jgi:hypothetical protein